MEPDNFGRISAASWQMILQPSGGLGSTWRTSTIDLVGKFRRSVVGFTSSEHGKLNKLLPGSILLEVSRV